MSTPKRNTLIFMALATVILFALAISLTGTELQPGQPLELGYEQMRPPSFMGEVPGGDTLMMLLRGLLAFAMLFLPVALVYMLFTSQGRRQLVGAVIFTILMVLILQMFNQQNDEMREPPPFEAPELGIDQAPIASGETPEVPEYISNPPEWVSWVVSLVIAVAITALAFGVYWFYKHIEAPGRTLERLAEQAEYAMQRIEAGDDLRQTILRCYQEMIRAVRETRGIQREVAMTPREFQKILEQQNLPAEPVNRLTRLFEEARYSVIEMPPQQGQLAILCLQDIAAACQAAQAAARQAAAEKLAAQQTAAAQAALPKGNRRNRGKST